MKKFFLTLAVGASFAMAGIAAADSGCGSKGGENVAMGADKAASCAMVCSSEAEKVAMAKGGAADATTTSGYALGNKVPDFTLEDTAGKKHNLSDFKDQVVVVVFYNQTCPYVVDVNPRLAAFTNEYKDKGVKVLAVDAGISNSVEDIKAHADKQPYSVLLNRDSSLARSFGATRTPEVYLIDKTGTLVYTGMFDSGSQGDSIKTPTKDAVDAILAGKEVTVQKTKAFGCTIKFAEAKKPAAGDSAG